MKKTIHPYECKTAKAGEIVYRTDFMGNALLFVSSGRLIICKEDLCPIAEVEEGHFVLLSAEKCLLAKAITPVETTLLFAGPLVDMITGDPEWNPDHPVVLPIFPSLARTLYVIDNYQKEKHKNTN